MLTRTLEWNLSFCLVGFLFGTDGQVRRAFVSERNKTDLTEACVPSPSVSAPLGSDDVG
jgi:autophagy-related protein 9